MSTAARLQTRAAEARPPSSAGHGSVLLQRRCACRSPTASFTGDCTECKSRKILQAKLAIGASNDPLEMEADRLADQVLAAPTHPTVGGTLPRIQRNAGQASGRIGEEAPASVDRVLAGSGSRLPNPVRQDMEQRFGHDFSKVRVHSGATAEQSARDVNAHAYTVGQDIVFAKGRYAPGTIEGRRLLAHEMAHVVQQTRTGSAAVAAPLLQKKGGYPKTVTIDNAEVSVASKDEEVEAQKIIANIKQRFGITFEAQKGLKALKNSVVGDPEQLPTPEEALRNPGAPKKKVKDLLDTSVWTVAQLRDLQTGLAFFSPVLGSMSRSASNLDPTTQQLTSVSRLNVGLNDADTATDKGVYGQFFSPQNHAAFFDAAGTATALADKKQSFLGTVVHEVAHAMLGANKTLLVSGLSPAFWTDDKTPANDPLAEQPVTPYGHKNAGEDLAEAVKFYFVEPATLLQKCPRRYAIIDKLVKAWRPKGPTSPKP